MQLTAVHPRYRTEQAAHQFGESVVSAIFWFVLGSVGGCRAANHFSMALLSNVCPARAARPQRWCACAPRHGSTTRIEPLTCGPENDGVPEQFHRNWTCEEGGYAVRRRNLQRRNVMCQNVLTPPRFTSGVMGAGFSSNLLLSSKQKEGQHSSPCSEDL